MNEAATPATLKSPTVSPNKVSELERFAGVLVNQNELLNILENRLHMVSSPTPPQEKAGDSGPHLSSLIDVAAYGNIRLQKLIDDLVI